ncbi:MAG: hypothetical protein AB7P03_01220 [Kofleriaceae bacterium]
MRNWLLPIAAVISASIAHADIDAGLKPAVTRSGWQLDFTGYVQADSVPWSQDSSNELDPTTGEPRNEVRVLIRRARLRANAHRDAMFGALELDGNTITGAAARLISAYVGYTVPLPATDTVPLVMVSAGLFKTPFGVEVPANERDKPFVESPAFARALFPGSYDAGVMIRGGYSLVRWSVAAVNGAPPGDAQWHGKDPSSSYDFVGRIGADVTGPYELRIEAGISALKGRGLHPGAPPTKESLQWIDESQDGRVQIDELQVIPGSPGGPSESFSRQAIGADVRAHWRICRLGLGTAFAEGVLATNLDRGLVYADPVAQGRDARHLGMSVGVVQDLGAYAQLGARYDRYDADRDASEQQGVMLGVDQVFSTLSVVAAGHWRDARFAVQYDHERNPFGRGDAGSPITRSADRVTLRAQVGF